MRDPLNFFEPWESLPAAHENQLTRAFLVVLRLVPIAHAEWLRLVAETRGPGAVPIPPLRDLSPAKFNTQTGQVGATAPVEAAPDEASAYRAVSVLQAGDVAADEAPAGESMRRAVFDGVVRYGDDLALVIESKLDGRFDERQAREITIGGAAWRVDPAVAKLRWRDIIAAWRGLLQRDLVAGAERAVIEDFLWLVQRHFDRLQPFAELAVCKGDDYLLLQRLGAILGEVGGGPSEIRAGRASLLLEGSRRVKFAYLYPARVGEAEEAVSLELYPADTLEQAKALYDACERVQRLLSLRNRGWEIRPHFHFGHMAKGFAAASGGIALEDYLSYWLAEIGGTGQVKRDRWWAYFDELVRQRIVDETDRETFERDFERTERMTATPRPGLRMSYQWAFEEAATLDARGWLVRTARDAVSAVLVALDESPLAPP